MRAHLTPTTPNTLKQTQRKQTPTTHQHIQTRHQTQHQSPHQTPPQQTQFKTKHQYSNTIAQTQHQTHTAS